MNKTTLVALSFFAVSAGASEGIAEHQDLDSLRPESVQWLHALTQCEPQQSLSVITERYPDVDCPTGGRLVSVGTDRNSDGRLDPGEIENIVELCDTQRDERLAELRTDNLCLHMEVASALRFSLQLERALAPEDREMPADLLRPLLVPSDT